MPAASRVHPSAPVPVCLPIWGSIVDDIWAVEASGPPPRDLIGPVWLGRVSKQWELAGVSVHSS
eukprot:411680-Lingulodinium_polyedra.AAC.1